MQRWSSCGKSHVAHEASHSMHSRVAFLSNLPAGHCSKHRASLRYRPEAHDVHSKRDGSHVAHDASHCSHRLVLASA